MSVESYKKWKVFIEFASDRNAKYLVCIIQFYISENGYGLIVQVVSKHAFGRVWKINGPSKRSREGGGGGYWSMLFKEEIP